MCDNNRSKTSTILILISVTYRTGSVCRSFTSSTLGTTPDKLRFEDTTW